MACQSHNMDFGKWLSKFSKVFSMFVQVQDYGTDLWS